MVDSAKKPSFFNRHRQGSYSMFILLFALCPLVLCVGFWLSVKTDLLADFLGYKIDRITGFPVQVGHVQPYGVNALVVENVKLLNTRSRESAGISVPRLTIKKLTDTGGVDLKLQGLVLNYHKDQLLLWKEMLENIKAWQAEIVEPPPPGQLGGAPILDMALEDCQFSFITKQENVLTLKINNGSVHWNRKILPVIKIESAELLSSYASIDWSGEFEPGKGVFSIDINNIRTQGKARSASVIALRAKMEKVNRAAFELNDLTLTWDKMLNVEGQFVSDGNHGFSYEVKNSKFDLSQFALSYADVLQAFAPDLKSGQFTVKSKGKWAKEQATTVDLIGQLHKVQMEEALDGELKFTLRGADIDLRFMPAHNVQLKPRIALRTESGLNLTGQLIKKNGKTLFKGFVNSIALGYHNEQIGLSIPQIEVLRPLSILAPKKHMVEGE